MTMLIAAALFWIVVHVGIAGTRVRQTLAGRVGDNAFRGIFSVLSVVAISLLVISYNKANAQDPVPLWQTPAWLGWMLVALMAVAFILFVGSVASPNPTAVGGEKLLDRDVRGTTAITRHPMLWSFTLWSLVHVIGNGTLVSSIFFGAFGLTSLVGMPSIDRKLAARDPAGWSRLSAMTSIVPFAAVARGSQRLHLRDIGLVPLLGGLALWAVLLLVHPKLFGVWPVPPS